MKLIIDNREKALCEQLSQQNINFEIKQLDLGDIIICDDNDNIILLIERKTISDLASSIIDGRYKEQSYRLTHHKTHNHNIIFLIEGDILNYKSYSRIKKSTIYSMLLTINYYKGFSVLRSLNLTETAVIIERFFDKFQRESSIDGFYTKNKSEIQEEYSDVVKCEKKLNITENNIHEIMLCQIPYISAHTAREILKKYDFKTLVNNVETIDISEIKISGKNGKERKISKRVVENLKKYL